MLEKKNKGENLAVFDDSYNYESTLNESDLTMDRMESERGQHKCSSVPIPKIRVRTKSI